MDNMTYTITVPENLFPYPPFTKVLIRDNPADCWYTDRFLCHLEGIKCPYQCVSAYWGHCIPFAGNEHLSGTSHPEDTPVCEHCGKAKPDCACKLGAITADGVRVATGDTVYDPHKQAACVAVSAHDGDRPARIYAYNADSLRCTPIENCYSKPCHKLPDGTVVTDGSVIEHPTLGKCSIFLDEGKRTLFGRSIQSFDFDLKNYGNFPAAIPLDEEGEI